MLPSHPCTSQRTKSLSMNSPAFARYTPIWQERFPTQLVPPSAKTAIVYLVLSHLTIVISLPTHEIFKQASHILPQEQRGTSPIVTTKSVSHGSCEFTPFLNTTPCGPAWPDRQCPPLGCKSLWLTMNHISVQSWVSCVWLSHSI